MMPVKKNRADLEGSKCWVVEGAILEQVARNDLSEKVAFE